MADFDGNPFADPQEINPFADPAVTEATSSSSVGESSEDYNPFSEEEKARAKDPKPTSIPPPPTKVQMKEKKDKTTSKQKWKPAPPERPKESEPAIMKPVLQADEPPPYKPAPSTFASPGDGELKKREEEIGRREKALQDRENNLARLGSGERPKNFPPFPEFCPSPLKPCFYINIKVEVPPSEQWTVYALLALLIYNWVLLGVNVVVAVMGAAAYKSNNGVDKRSDYLTTMGVSILYLVLFVPGSLFCWFFPLYHAYKKDSSLSFMWFFFVMLFQVLGFVLNGIGIPKMGACGYFNGVAFFNGHNAGSITAGAFFMIMGTSWIIAAVVTTILILFVHRYYRSSGKTLNQAVEEGVSGAAKNKHFRSAVRSGVSTGVKGAFEK